MGLVSDKLSEGRPYRILTGVDQFTRECVFLAADRSMSGGKVIETLNQAMLEGDGKPEIITRDNGSEFAGGPWKPRP